MNQPASPSPQQLRIQPESPHEQAPAASQDPERYWLENVYKGE